LKTNYAILCLAVTLLAEACNNTGKNSTAETDIPKPVPVIKSKPPSNYPDTLLVEEKAAVFFYPDSIQLKKIEEITDKTVFESTTHESFYQIRNSKIVLKENWPGLKIIEAKNTRFLLFRKSNAATTVIDLDTKNDAYGLFLFDGKKGPHFADMMNIETELFRYFSK
jgi:hypothetical protein